MSAAVVAGALLLAAAGACLWVFARAIRAAARMPEPMAVPPGYARLCRDLQQGAIEDEDHPTTDAALWDPALTRQGLTDAEITALFAAPDPDTRRSLA